MRKQPRSWVSSCAVALASSLLGSASVRAADIDVFTTSQGPLSGSPISSSSVGGAMLGAERDLRAERITGTGTPIAEVNGTHLVFSSPAGTRGEARVTWDGVDGSDAIAPSGLAGQDLTAAGANALRLTVASASAGAVVVVEVFTSGALSSTRGLILPAVAVPTTFALPYSSFVARLGAGATFTNVGAITLAVRGDGVAMSLDAIQTAVVAGSTVTATKAGTPANVNPGGTIDYQIDIQSQSSGRSASNVGLTDPLDGNTTLVAASLEISPVAFDDVYVSATSPLVIAAAAGVLANDKDYETPADALTVSASNTTTSRGGTVSVATDGGFTYTAPAGLSGPDTFTYTVDDGNGLTDTAVVTVSITDTEPSITATTPANNASNLATNTNVTVTFSEAVNVTGNWFEIACPTSGTRLPADTVVSGGPATFTIDPNADFAAGEACTARIFAVQVTDQDANDPPDAMAANHTFDFAMEGAPSVTATTPTNGAAGRAANASLTITFSEAVNVTGNWLQIVCGTSGTRNVADTVITGGPTTFTVDPNTNFTAGESCTTTVFAAQVTDQDANDPPDNMLASFPFTFTVDVAPTVTATTPVNGALAAAPNTDVTITFSEPVDVTGSWFQIVCATSGTRNVANSVVSGGPTTFTVNPNADLAAGESCTATVFAAQVADQDAGDPPDTMAADHVFTFATDAAPSVTATTPVNGATAQTSNTNLTITFSEPVNVTGNWFQIVCATSGTRNPSDTVVTGGPTTFTVNPNADFAAVGELCTTTAFAAQVADQDANDPPDSMAANYVFSFTTDAAPTVTATTPINGATSQVSNTNLTVTFSEPVNVTGSWFQIVCGTSGTRNVADTAVSGGPTTFTINPNADFTSAETCTTTIVATQVADQDANDPPDTMTANHVFSFSVDAAPSVTTTVPANAATQQSGNTNVTVTFSEPVDVAGNWLQIACATSGTRNVADVVVTGGPTTFTVNPNTDFTAGELCTVTVVAAQVADQDANDPPDNMLANFVFSFTIDQAPSVSSTTPANGAIDQAASTNISVTFSEAVDVTGNWFQIVCPTSTRNVGQTVVTGGPTTFTINPTTDLPRGEVCVVTVFAAQVADQDAGDPPDNMATNHVFSFGVKPLAAGDARNVTGNVRIQTTVSGFTVLTNDVGTAPLSIAASDSTSVRGGTVAVAANGTFTYNPPAGYDGADSFNYTVSNAAGSDIGTVTLTVSGMIWFVNNSSSSCTTVAGNCGRLTSPYSTLAGFETDNGTTTHTNGGDIVDPEAGDHVFIYTGSGNYTGPVTLENNQRVVGQGATSSIVTHAGLTLAADSDALPTTGGTRPTITSPGNGIVLASGNQLHGLSFSNTTGTSILGTVNVGTFAMSEIGVSNTTGSGPGITFTGGGTVTATGLNTITTNTGTALNVANTNIGAGGLTFRSIATGTASGGPANGIVLNTTGTAGGLTVTGNGGTCTLATPTCTGGTIRNTTGDGISLSSTKNVSLSFTRLLDTGGQGIKGSAVDGFTLLNSVNVGSGNADEENAMIFGNDNSGLGAITNGLVGTALIQDVVVDSPIQWGLRVFNNLGSGTLNLTARRLTVQNNINVDGLNFGEAALSLRIEAGTANVLVDDSDFLTVDFGLDGQALGTGALNLTAQNTTWNQVQSLPFGINFVTAGASAGRLKATGNTMIGCGGAVAATMCSLGIDMDASGTSSLHAIVTGNTVSNTGIGGGMELIVNDNANARIEARNNNFTVPPDEMGMNFLARSVLIASSTGRLDAILGTNTVNGISSSGLFNPGISLLAGSSTGSHAQTVCANVTSVGGAGGNVLNGTANPGLTSRFALRMRTSTTFILQGYTGSASSTSAVTTFVDAGNSSGTLNDPTFVGTGGTHVVNYVNGTCNAPATPTLP
jgi:large repetitive protein